MANLSVFRTCDDEVMWLAIPVDPDELHILPDSDLIEHARNGECVCGPALTFLEDGLKMYTHASLDGRELSEPDWKG